MTIKQKNIGRRLGFTLIELMIVVAIIGILAAIAIPALTKFIRKSKTSEFRANIAKMYDGNVGFFQADSVARGAVPLLTIGGNPAGGQAHSCPTNTLSAINATITPPLATNCNAGSGGRCIPAGTGAGSYALTLWNDNGTWNGLSYEQTQGHYGHYDFSYVNGDTAAFGNCQFTAQAFGDFDDDAIFSTFERSGSCDKAGCAGAVGLTILNEVE